LSLKSSEFPEAAITENLANILLKQGKSTQAIAIYEKLVLKYPQKKSYFATQIQNLKKK